MKTPTATSSTRLAPTRSLNHPEAGMDTARLTRKATTTTSTLVARTWKSRASVGTATLTMVVSMMAMNIAMTKTTPTAIR